MPHPTIISVLKKDHKAVNGLLKQAIATSDGATTKRADLCARIIEALTTHMAFEESAIYAVLMQKVKTKDVSLEAVEEHQQIKRLLGDLAGTACDDERWKAKMTVLMEDVKHHVKEEEQAGGLFADIQSALDRSELEDLAREYESFKSGSVR